MRISCCVPLFRRTREHASVPVIVEGQILDFGAVWICQKHWSALPLELRRRHASAKAAVRKTGTYEGEMESNVVWKKCKETAADMAFGLR